MADFLHGTCVSRDEADAEYEQERQRSVEAVERHNTANAARMRTIVNDLDWPALDDTFFKRQQQRQA